MSRAMEEAISETERRRKIQIEYNTARGIKPETVKKAIAAILERHAEEAADAVSKSTEALKKSYNILIPAERKKLISALSAEMLEHAKKLEFEQAAVLRDEIQKIENAAAPAGRR
jgi:excinuclease ABC subunit B